MPRLQDTAYPRLKSVLSARDLNTAFTPTPDELLLARRLTKGSAAQLGFLVLLKLYQRLGRAMSLAEAPQAIIEHVARVAVLPSAALAPDAYDHSGTQQRHLAAIRQHLQVQPYGAAGRHAMIAALADAAATKYELEDLINVGIEQLVRQRFELPAFDTLNRAARRVRATYNRALYKRVFEALSKDQLASIDALFITDLTTLRTPWNELKADAGNPTLTHLRDLVACQRWLASQAVGTDTLGAIPPVTVRHFAEEAKTLDAGRMQALEPHKRMTLAVALLATQAARALDDLGEMFVRRMQHVRKAPSWHWTATAPPRSSAPTTWSPPCTNCSSHTRWRARPKGASRLWTRSSHRVPTSCWKRAKHIWRTPAATIFHSSGARTGAIARPCSAYSTRSRCGRPVRTPVWRTHCGFFGRTLGEQASGYR
jgi:Domain of unknown function (DUF4158)